MMEDSAYRNTYENGTGTRQRHRDRDSHVRYRDGPNDSESMVRTDETETTRTGDSIMRRTAAMHEEDYHPALSSSGSSSSYLGSCCRKCCTFQNFCYIVQLVNCGLVVALIYLASIEYPKIEALQAQVEEDQEEIAALSEEVREKQEGQIQSLHKAVEEEQQFNFLSLAGFFTLLTCLISMFHMTTHIHKFGQPKIQSKIISILWMSPIYSVTSFLTLIFPGVEGWMAIVKDFYESYCIYVFLSFLIAVLGEGSRDKAVVKLAKHANHLDNPTCCLACLYEPPPDTSDHAKANAVMTQCQIYCLQFTLVRPLTTIFSVFVLHRGRKQPEEEEEFNDDDEFNDDAYDNVNEGDSDVDGSSSNGNNSDNNINSDNNSQTNSTDTMAAESSPSSAAEEPPTASSYPQFGNASSTTSATNSTWDGNTGDGGTRTLQYAPNKRRRTRGLQQGEGGAAEGETTGMSSNSENSMSNNDEIGAMMEFPTFAPVVGGGDYPFPTSLGDENWSPTVGMEGMPIGDSAFEPTFGSNGTGALAPAYDPIANTSNFDYNNTGFGGMFQSNTTTNISSSIYPTLPPTLPGEVNGTSFGNSELVDQTKAYFRSPGFAVAMVVNVSIFFAFAGLLKLYHAVREELLWCRPFPKFLTIKAVVFLTFWQGLAIFLWLFLTADPDEKADASFKAHRYQNLLICVEMLLVAISQWCVFPAIEWEKDYEPRQMHTPGIGINDFVSDIGQIVKKSRKGRRRKKRGGPHSNKAGLYHMPGFASIMASQYDGFGGPVGGGERVDSFEDDDEFENSSFDSSFDSSVTDNREQFADADRISNDLPSSGIAANRERIRSDDTGGSGYSLDDNDLELL